MYVDSKKSPHSLDCCEVGIIYSRLGLNVVTLFNESSYSVG